ncbi:beta-ketoacyl synthase N-terminal-like domain-containing protein [Flavobacteriaceae bacterium M23B6Z8]
MPDDVRTVVTGMGIVSSIGSDINSFRDSLKKGVSGIVKATYATNPCLSVEIAALIRDFSFVEKLKNLPNIPEEKLLKARQLGQRAPFVIQTSIISALQAWEQAGLFENASSPDKIGLIVAGQNSTQNYQYKLISDFKENPEYLSPRYALEFLETNQLGILSELLGIQGEGCVVGGASATGNVGVIKGHQLVKSGTVDICLVIGVVTELSPMDMQGFINIGAMGGKALAQQPEKACRPFDKKHEGFIYGQASGSLVIESESSASKRNQEYPVEIASGAINMDANSSANPDKEGEYIAMGTALKRAGITVDDIDYINSHGSSSPLGDKTEAEAITDLLGKNVSNVWINATKGLTGHCLYSAGMVETIATIIQMKEGFLHPNLNLLDPITNQLKFCGEKAVTQEIKAALSNSFGFGGINTSVVIKNIHT